MKKAEFKRRFLFVPVICVAMLLLIIIYRLVAALGVLNMDFAALDSRFILWQPAESEISKAKHPLMPETKNEGKGYVDINNASVEELDKLPQIGENRAKAIAGQRQMMGGFSCLKDLLCTKGIGIQTFKEIEPYIMITEYLGDD